MPILFEESHQGPSRGASGSKALKMTPSRYLRDEMDTGFIQEAVERNDVNESYGDLVDQLLKEEYKLFNESEEDNEEMGIASCIQRRMRNARDERSDRSSALASLMWRLRQQSVAFEAYMALLEEGYVGLSGFQYDVIFQAKDETVWALHMALSRSFEFGRRLNHPPIFADCFYYAVPGLWLATMIVRNAVVPLNMIVDFIDHRGYFGTFDADMFSKCWPERKELETNPNAQTRIPSGPQGFIGLHLPMGMEFPCKMEDIYYTIDEPLRRCEEVFARYFRIPETVFVPAGRIWMP
jgi:hypothetical protein